MSRYGVAAGWFRRLPVVLASVLAIVSPLAVMPSAAQAVVVVPSVSLSAPATAESLLAFTLSGAGVPASPGRVVVVQRLSGSTWVVAGQATETSTGGYAVLTSAPSAGRFTYRAVAQPWMGALAVTSVSRVVTVHSPYILLTPSTAMAAETVRTTGILPGILSRAVWVQRLSGRTWVTVVKTVTSKTGSYVASFRAPVVGSYSLRSLAPAVTIARKVRAQYVSVVKTLKVVAQTGVLTIPATLPQGGSGAATMTFAPARAARVVALQTLTGVAWTNVASGTQSGAGVATLPLIAGSLGSHSYRAYTAAAAGAAAFWSATKTLVVTLRPVTLVSAIPASTSVELYWTSSLSSSVTGVMIRRAPGAVPPASASAGDLVTDSAGTSFNDTGLTPDTQYAYALFAHDGAHAYSGAASVVTATIGPPGPVTGLAATPDSTTILLSWTNPGDASLTGIVIRRADGDTPPSFTGGELIADVDAAEATFTDTLLIPGHQYSYALFAHDGAPVHSTAVTLTTSTIAPGTISGTVSDAAGSQSGLQSVTVKVTSPTTGTTGTATTGADGRYLVTGLAAGTDYTVCFLASPVTTGGSSDALGYVDQCYDNQPVSGPSPNEVAVVSGADTPGIDAALAGGGAIAGTASEAAGAHQLLANVDVTVQSEATGTDGTAVTAADGTYTVNGLAAGTDYTVCFTSAEATGGSSSIGYVDQCYDNQPAGNPTPVTATLGATTQGVNAHLSGGGAISGVVTDAAHPGQGLTGVEVSVTSPGGFARSATTSGDGSYRVSGLEGRDDFTVCFLGSRATGGAPGFGFRDKCFDDQPTTGTPTPVSVVLGFVTESVNGALDPRAEPHT